MALFNDYCICHFGECIEFKRTLGKPFAKTGTRASSETVDVENARNSSENPKLQSRFELETTGIRKFSKNEEFRDRCVADDRLGRGDVRPRLGPGDPGTAGPGGEGRSQRGTRHYFVTPL